MTKSARIKPEPEIASMAEFEATLDHIALAQLERDRLALDRDQPADLRIIGDGKAVAA